MSRPDLRVALAFAGAEPDDGLRHALADPRLAAVELRGAAVADETALRALAATIHAAGPGRPRLVMVDPRLLLDHDDLAPPDPSYQAFELASGTEDLEITLDVLAWGKRLAAAGIDLVLAPRLDALPAAAGPSVRRRLAGAWTESLLAAGLIASAGALVSGAAGGLPAATADGADDLLVAYRAAFARGLQAVHLAAPPDPEALAATILHLRDGESFDGVLISPPVATADEALACAAAGCDLVRLDSGLSIDELPAAADAATDEERVSRRLDRLIDDWLV
jgi:hypothetical protein